MTIWKFPLAVTDEQVIEMPKVNRPLTVQMQAGYPCYWAMVNPESPRIKVKILTFGTGHEEVTEEMQHLGTYQMADGRLVFHVFAAGWSE